MSRWSTVAIYGVGLIGGSIGLALRKKGVADRVLGIGRNAERLATAKKLEAIDDYVTDLTKAVPPDVVILCTPVQLAPGHCQAIANAFPNALITDAGSTKQALVAEIETLTPAVNFVGSHPLAGSDKSGVEFARADLYDDRMVIVTPTENSNPDSVKQVLEFWNSIGARTCTMDPASHDRALAITSHLPHVVASALAADTPEDLLHLIAGGWRDTTRIAAADVEMWTQILQENNTNVLESLRSLQARLSEFEEAINANNRETITRLLTAGKQRRDALGS